VSFEGQVDEAGVASEVGANLGQAQALLVKHNGLDELVSCKGLVTDLDSALS
jgi:hypothetical protein